MDMLKRGLFYLGVILIVVVSVFPFYYAVLTAFKSGTSLFLIEYVPKTFDFSNFESVLTNGSFIFLRFSPKPSDKLKLVGC